MQKHSFISITPSPWLDPIAAADNPAIEELNVPALLTCNITKMQNHQVTCQWIRTWSFALIGAYFGYVFVHTYNIRMLVLISIGMELTIFAILMKDIGWHSPFWRYRDRARLCEAFLLGNLSKENFRSEYMLVTQPTKTTLLRDAFSLKKLVMFDIDFIKAYLMIVLAVALIFRVLVKNI